MRTLNILSIVILVTVASADAPENPQLNRKRLRKSEDDDFVEPINPIYRAFPRPHDLQHEVKLLIEFLNDLVKFDSPDDPMRSLTIYDGILDPELIAGMERSLKGMAMCCSRIQSIQRELDHPEAATMIEELGRNTEELFNTVSSLPLLKDIVSRINEQYITSIRHMEIPTLMMQAANLLDRYVFMWPQATPELGGWDLDIKRFGVDLTEFLPDYFTYFDKEPSDESRGSFARELEARIRALSAFDAHLPAGFIQPRDHCLVQMLSRELDRMVSRDRSNIKLVDLVVESSLERLIIPNFKRTLQYVWAVPMEFSRSRAKLVSDLFACARPSLSLKNRLELVHEFAFVNSREDIEGRVVGYYGRPHRVEMVLPRVDRNALVDQSSKVLNAVLSQSPFLSGGLSVSYANPESRGDGVTRDWLRQMLERYMRVHDGSDDSAEDKLQTFWEYADDAKTLIRPRRVEEMVSPNRMSQLLDGLKMSGTLLGLAMSKRINPGVNLSPAALALLRDPEDNIDQVARAEDPVLCDHLDSLRSLDWQDESQVSMLIGEGTVAVGGIQQPVNQENLERYIRTEKYKRTIESIRSEMNHVLLGMNRFLRRGSLEELSKKEIMLLLNGDGPISAEVLENAINLDVTAEATHLGTWLMDIVREMTQEDLVRLHTFVTASPRKPTDADSRKWITFRVVGEPIPIEAPENSMGLPTGRSCFGLLLVPHYPSKAILKRKLLYAITESLTLEEY